MKLNNNNWKYSKFLYSNIFLIKHRLIFCIWYYPSYIFVKSKYTRINTRVLRNSNSWFGLVCWNTFVFFILNFKHWHGIKNNCFSAILLQSRFVFWNNFFILFFDKLLALIFCLSLSLSLPLQSLPAFTHSLC